MKAARPILRLGGGGILLTVPFLSFAICCLLRQLKCCRFREQDATDGTHPPEKHGWRLRVQDEPTLLQDVHRLRIEHALRKSEERFRQVVESAPNAMVMINSRGLIEMINAQAERVFGYARSELLGQPIELLVPVRFSAHHPALRASFFAQPQSRPMGEGRDLYGLRKDGSEFPVEIGLNPIETEDGTMVLSAIVDISDRKQKEERIQQALKEKDLLLAEIHHRVKNNLQVIDSLLGLQSARIDDAQVLAMLRDSQTRIRSMALIHQTLYQSKDFARVDFASFLDSLAPTLIASYEIDPSRIALMVHTIGVQLPISAAIPCGLIVNELISNAIKHGFPDGRGGEIEVRLVNETPTEVSLTVSDNGVGLPDDIDPDVTGTLGLQLVSLLTEQLGGSLAIQRANPTRFSLRFPSAKQTESPHVPSPRSGG
ncbi:PAS domain S-box protein [Azospirillum griseum]|uniref:PAS domain S-box protein n=2 Tax=Azospirillum griseum TaxID=2496639 RepID=A0A431VDH2_9PROT|nr:PAS domain S-box protein [Azospirillum griseum]